MKFDEDNLVQKTTADYLRDALGWESVFAYNQETFGSDGLLGRENDQQVVLTRYLRQALERLNPNLPTEAYDNALRQLTEISAASSTLQTNREKYDLHRGGVKVTYRTPKGGLETRTLRVFDFTDPANNHFLTVRELWIKGPLYRRRADIVGFVNGLPLLFMELKNVHKDIRRGYDENLADYKDTIPHIFHHNAFIVLGNGLDAKIGSLTAPFEFFREWKRLHEEEPGVVNMETLLKGICGKANFLDLFENFILFDDSGERTVKAIAQNQQYLGVNRAIEAVENREELGGKLGVFWHTRGAGKSYSMVYFARKVHRKLGGNFTFVVLTDRDDLDDQIYKTFTGCGAVSDGVPSRAGSGKHLRQLLSQHSAYVFSLIQKFNQDVAPDEPYSDRSDIIVMVDEAHRSQYGRLALNQRNALPNAHYIAFTGTPLFKGDEITRQVFGDYVSKYDFQRAVEDQATVPLFYDARGEKLGLATTELNEKIAAKLEELEINDVDVEQRLQRELGRDYHIITAPERQEAIARDFVEHYANAWETGKAMFVAIDKVTAVKMHGLIEKYWQEKIDALEATLPGINDEDDRTYHEAQLAWMKETKAAVVISEEQGEVDKFRKWGLDITPHRKLMKEGFVTADGKTLTVEDAFKKTDHPFRIVIVCAMWLTGFDVKSLSTLYLDKALKAHTLMQAIARANRVSAGKNNGLIVDYCGILKNLRQALATWGPGAPDGGEPSQPAKPDEELLEELAEAIEMVRGLLASHGFRLEEVVEKTGFERIAAIEAAKDIINENDETRKRFEIAARSVFKKFKACLNIDGINGYRTAYDSINIIYKKLQDDRQNADITAIMQELQQIVGDSIVIREAPAEDGRLYDISAIDFDRLRAEFAKRPSKHTDVQNLRDAIEQRLHKMIQQNPLRVDFQERYENIIQEYNEEKDRMTIEQTFEALIKFVESLDEEQSRAVREGLDQDTLALFDLLKKEGLSAAEVKRIKAVAKELHDTLQAELAKVFQWQSKQATRNQVKQRIFDFLWNDQTGLPESYDPDEISQKSELIFGHIFYQSKQAGAPLHH